MGGIGKKIDLEPKHLSLLWVVRHRSVVPKSCDIFLKGVFLVSED